MKTMHKEESALFDGLMQRSGDGGQKTLDREACMVLADWYEEGGSQDRADCLRWMARTGKRPMGTQPGSTWFHLEKTANESDRDSDLTAPLAREIMIRSDTYRDFDSCQDAIEALLEAWPKAIAKGWIPE